MEFGLTKPLHELVALRSLSDGMAQIEAQHRERIKRGDDVGEADRDAAQLALTGIAKFFAAAGIEVKAHYSAAV